MSAIVGIYYLDGRPVDQMDLERMTATLNHRGPDGAGVWREETIGLGHRLLCTTQESLAEKLPLVSKSGDLVISADARIDNRSELIGLLGLNDRAPGEIADSELIVAAYEKWGESCPERLLGDFVFVLWDFRRQMLFGARDHFGVKPLYYYYHPDHVFACASEIKALLCLPEVPRRLNEVQVADYLEGIFEDKASTFYQDILRLPPAHSVTVSAQGTRLHCYWMLDPSSELRLGSDEEYAAAYREIFTEAVRCRLRSAFAIGSHLSGGLDSSSVTCVAHTLLEKTPTRQLHTFSNIFDDVPQCDERPFINAVLDQGGYFSHYVHADRSSPLVDLERVFWHQDEPSIGPNHFLPWELNRAASQAGVRVILDGFDGDTTVSHGAVRFTELAYAGQWATFALEANAVSQHFKVSPVGLLQAYGLPYLEELARKQRWVAFVFSINQINRYFQASRRELLWRHGLRPFIPSQLLNGQRVSRNGIDPIIKPDFARSVGLQERRRALHGERVNPPRTVREDQWRALTSGLFTSVLELSDRCAAAFSVEVRHPFMDKRLIELCLALPPEQKLHQGWGRIVMRRAMVDILPEEICWRGGKTDMNPNFLHGLLTVDRNALDEAISQPSASLTKYVDSQVLHQVYQRLISREKVKIADAMTVWKAATLACWLRYVGFEDSETALKVGKPVRSFNKMTGEAVFSS
jgi:asparagine synthase (glutamine-hydrolysing)